MPLNLCTLVRIAARVLPENALSIPQFLRILVASKDLVRFRYALVPF